MERKELKTELLHDILDYEVEAYVASEADAVMDSLEDKIESLEDQLKWMQSQLETLGVTK